jgi:septal ring factor EnvC (AmiA/AmiB activator)
MNKELSIASIESMTAVSLYQEGGLDEVLEAVRNEVTAEVMDATTPKGRDRIKSVAYKVAKTKTKLDDLGKDLVSGWKAQSKTVDALRKQARDNLDALKEEVRRPVTEWEQADEKRVNAIQERLGFISALTEAADDLNSAELAERLQSLNDFVIDDTFQEFKGYATERKKEVTETLTRIISIKKKEEAEQEELNRLRAEEEARKQKERDEEIAKKAVAQAEKAHKAALEKAETDRDNAVKAERDRIKQESIEAAREAKMREENKEHRRKINKAAKEALIAGGVNELSAELAIKLIAKGSVANVSIRY